MKNKNNIIMKNNYFKIISSTIITGAFLFIAFGSGDDEKKSEWKKNSKECFCGKEFKSSHTIEAIDMTTKVITILNCDGTYTSKEDWGTSKENEETYRNTAGRSSGNNGNFSGTWQIIESNMPNEVEQFFSQGGFKANDYTIIKYNSSNGKERYAYIQHTEGKSDLYIGLVTFDRDCYEPHTYKEEDLDMYSGLTN